MKAARDIAARHRDRILQLARDHGFEHVLIAGPVAQGLWSSALTLIVTPAADNTDAWDAAAELREAIEALTGIPVDLVWSGSFAARRLASSARPLEEF